MTGNNYYCCGEGCRKTTSHVRVVMDRQTYFYCVHCGRRLEARSNMNIEKIKPNHELTREAV